jgi:hypothetical protein
LSILVIWAPESLEAACDEDSVDDEGSWDDDEIASDDEETSEPWEDLPAAESMEDELISDSWGNRISSDVDVPSQASINMAADVLKMASA